MFSVYNRPVILVKAQEAISPEPQDFKFNWPSWMFHRFFDNNLEIIKLKELQEHP